MILYRDRLGNAKKASDFDVAKHPKGRSGHRGQTLFPETQDLASHGISIVLNELLNRRRILILSRVRTMLNLDLGASWQSGLFVGRVRIVTRLNRLSCLFVLIAFASLHVAAQEPALMQPNVKDIELQNIAAGEEPMEAEDADGTAPLAPEKNLLGERTKLPDDDGPTIDAASEVARITALMDKSLELVIKQQSIVERMVSVSKQIEEKKTLAKRNPVAYEGILAELNVQGVKLTELSGALSLPPNDPQVQAYYATKARIVSLLAQKQLIEQETTQLPHQLRAYQSEQIALQNEAEKFRREAAQSSEAWSELLTILTPLPSAIGLYVVKECDTRIAQYPDLHSLRGLKGCMWMQQGRYDASATELMAALKILESSPDPMRDTFRLRYVLNLAWVNLQLNQLDRAGSLLSQARALNGRSYELLIIEAHLAHLRGRSKVAFETYQRAASVQRKQPHAYRMAAEMTLQSQVRDANTAFSLAKKACDLDEFNDYRNHLVMARACHAVKRPDERDVWLTKAMTHASAEHHASIKQEAEALKADGELP